MSSNIYPGIKAALVVVVMLCLVAAAAAVVKWGNSLTPARTITVTADASATVSPDLATVSFSEVTVGTDPTQIETQNVNQINSAIKLIEQDGIAANDISTTDYNLSPNYSYNYKTGNTAIVSYTITETESVNITDFTKIPTILSGLANLGVNQIGQVSFTVKDPDSDLTTARAEAFAKAQAKAQQIAEDNGVQLGEIVNLSESNNNPGPLPVYNEMASEASGAAATPIIEPGTDQLTDTVSITYAIQ